MYFNFHADVAPATVGNNRNATSFSLLKVLHFNALNEKRQFCDKGNKAGAKAAWQEPERAELGRFVEEKMARGTREVCIV